MDWKSTTFVGWALAAIVSPKVYFVSQSITIESRKRLHYAVLCVLVLLFGSLSLRQQRPLLSKILMKYCPSWMVNLFLEKSTFERTSPQTLVPPPLAIEPLETMVKIQDQSLATIPIPPYRKHSYTDKLVQVLAQVQQIYSLNSSWTHIQIKEGISIATRPFDGLPFSMVRGDAFFPFKADDATGDAPTLEEWMSVIRNTTARKVWDHRFFSGKLLESLSPDEFISWSAQKGVFPVAGRDFVTMNAMIHPSASSGNAMFYVSSSLSQSHPKAPPCGYEGRVRGDLKIAAWRLCPDIQNGNHGMNVSYMVGVDVKGNIPQSVIKLVQTQTPLCINQVYKYLNSFGPLPFIIKSSSGPCHPFSVSGGISDIEEVYDSNTQQYTIHYQLAYGVDESMDGEAAYFAKIAVALPSRIFKSGAKVTTKQIFKETGMDAFVHVKGTWYPSSDKRASEFISPLSAGILLLNFGIANSQKCGLTNKNGDDEEDEEGLVVRKAASTSESLMATLQSGDIMKCTIFIQSHNELELNDEKI